MSDIMIPRTKMSDTDKRGERVTLRLKKSLRDLIQAEAKRTHVNENQAIRTILVKHFEGKK
jgi:uncharacterized protein (DUF1778 family)